MSVDHGSMPWFTGERPIADAAPTDVLVMVSGDDVETAQRTVPAASDGYAAYLVTAFPLPGSGAVGIVSDPSLLLGSDPDRRKAIIRNVGVGAVRIGPLAQVALGAGFLLPAGAVHQDITVTGAVYVVCDGAVVIPNAVSVWVEYNRQ